MSRPRLRTAGQPGKSDLYVHQPAAAARAARAS
jgi:hypothetical protein